MDTMCQCVKYEVPFHFKQTGANFKRGEQIYHIPRKDQQIQAAKAKIDYMPPERFRKELYENEEQRYPDLYQLSLPLLKRQGIISIVAVIVPPFSLQVFKVVAENNLIAADRLVWIYLKKKHMASSMASGIHPIDISVLLITISRHVPLSSASNGYAA